MDLQRGGGNKGKRNKYKWNREQQQEQEGPLCKCLNEGWECGGAGKEIQRQVLVSVDEMKCITRKLWKVCVRLLHTILYSIFLYIYVIHVCRCFICAHLSSALAHTHSHSKYPFHLLSGERFLRVVLVFVTAKAYHSPSVHLKKNIRGLGEYKETPLNLPNILYGRSALENIFRVPLRLISLNNRKNIFYNLNWNKLTLGFS